MESNLSLLLSIRIREAGISQARLGKMLGMSPSYLSELMSGSRGYADMNIARLRPIAKFLQLSAIEVFVLAKKIVADDWIRPDGTKVTTEQIRSLAGLRIKLRKH